MDLALDNLQCLLCHKTKPNTQKIPIESTNTFFKMFFLSSCVNVVDMFVNIQTVEKTAHKPLYLVSKINFLRREDK